MWPCLHAVTYIYLHWVMVNCNHPLSDLDNMCLSPVRTWLSNIICCGLFCAQWVKMRGNCSFCWYWWSRLPSLFIVLSYNEKSWKLYIIFLSTKPSDMKNGLLFVQPSSWLSLVGMHRSSIPWPALFHQIDVTKLKVKPYMIHMFAFLLTMLKVD